MQLEGECGVHDYKNCMEFTDEVLKAWPDIDANRLAVTGRSYGGYMTNWIIGHTERFKAAVSIVSISNWISYHGCSDYTWFGFWENDSTPWQDVDKLWWHSPIKYANKCTTPHPVHTERVRLPLSPGAGRTDVQRPLSAPCALQAAGEL